MISAFQSKPDSLYYAQVAQHTFLTTIPPRLWAMKMRGVFLDCSLWSGMTFLGSNDNWPYIAADFDHSQAIEQVSSKVLNSRPGSAECQPRVIPECHDSRFWKGFGEEVLQPEFPRLGVCPRFLCCAIQAMHSDDTVYLIRQHSQASSMTKYTPLQVSIEHRSRPTSDEG